MNLLHQIMMWFHTFFRCFTLLDSGDAFVQAVDDQLWDANGQLQSLPTFGAWNLISGSAFVVFLSEDVLPAQCLVLLVAFEAQPFQQCDTCCHTQELGSAL